MQNIPDFLEPLNRAFFLLPDKMDTPEARVQIIATAIQESDLNARRQAHNGPAVSVVQFERIAIKDVMERQLVMSRAICATFKVEFRLDAIYRAMQLAEYDALSFAFARLNYWGSRLGMPILGDIERGWEMYFKTWRPGKPAPQRWAESYWRAYGALIG